MFNILKREIRINKHGFPVIKLVRDETQIDHDAASMNIPSVTEVKVDPSQHRRENLVSELSSKLGQELGPDTKAMTLRGYSTWTLEVLEQAFGDSDELGSFMNKTHYFRDDEDMVRSAAIFSDEVPDDLRMNIEPVFQSVKAALGMDNLSDAEEGTENHEAVTSIVRVAMESAQLEFQRTNTRSSERRMDRNGRFTTRYTADKLPSPKVDTMTPELAKIITEYPDRTDDIIEHIKGRYDTRQALDPDFLRINLNNASSSLADGLL